MLELLTRTPHDETCALLNTVLHELEALAAGHARQCLRGTPLSFLLRARVPRHVLHALTRRGAVRCIERWLLHMDTVILPQLPADEVDVRQHCAMYRNLRHTPLLHWRKQVRREIRKGATKRRRTFQ